MTTVTFVEGASCLIIRAKGHAEDTETCAAISMLLTTFANWAANYGLTRQKLEAGDSTVTIPADETAVELADIAFQLLADDGKIVLKKVQKLGQDL